VTNAADADLHVVLVEPEIHWNTGNAGRTCLAAGAQLHLVGPLGFSLDDKEVRRAGLDYWPRVAPRVWADWASFERALPSLGAPFLFTARAPRNFQDVVYPRPAVLIFGRESVGLDARILDSHAAHTVAIPMRDRALRSLNLSTSVALGLYEARRQWGWG
jgi:tRNA (cytidine/uridine-2'-O-)-methyltransferase